VVVRRSHAAITASNPCLMFRPLTVYAMAVTLTYVLQFIAG
jgi:hypothetical protein